MKRPLIIFAFAALFGVQASHAQQNDDFTFGIFNHLSVGASFGTTGLGLELAAPITEYIDVRAGYSFLPKISYKTDVDYKSHGQTKQTEVEGKLNWGDAKLLFDVYPFKGSSFHATVGAYLGKDEIVKVQNNDPLNDVEEGEGLFIGDYIVGVDENKIAHATINVKKFKPYVGIGIGRSVPKKRVGVAADLGVQFWGSPTVYGLTLDGQHWQKVTSKDTGHEDGGFIETVSKITVFPVLTIRINGRIF